jgi:SAM-dependent methyltransferase
VSARSGREGSVPLPPVEIAERAGPLREADGAEASALERTEWWDPRDPAATYDAVGAASRQAILSLLPPEFSFEGKRVLDFGCGAGRVLRHFLAEAETAEVWGCDIHREGVEWLQANLSPPLRVFANEESPPLPFEEGSLDLVWALSVFTHLTDAWSAWLLELHRVLAPGGLLIATFCGSGAFWVDLDEDWDEDRTGMNVIHPWKPWNEGGPLVFHSEWWLRAHWGRAFEILELRRDGFAFPDGYGQGAVVMRKLPVSLTIDDLERDERDEPREMAARRNNLRQLRTGDFGALRDRYAARIRAYEKSRSWRLTRPLRSLAAVSRRLRRPGSSRPPR